MLTKNQARRLLELNQAYAKAAVEYHVASQKNDFSAYQRAYNAVNRAYAEFEDYLEELTK